MKIRGRFIGILAVLGLLLVLVPLAPAGAVAGEVTLTGGEKGQYFSDRPLNNVVTIQVQDVDLDPTKAGTARTVLAAAVLVNSAIDLSTLVVSGEKDRTDKFDGGENNPLCDHDSDDDAADLVRYQAGSPDSERFVDPTNRGSGAAPAACMSKGDLMFTDGNVTAYTGTPGTDTALALVPSALETDDVYSFNLKSVARDRQAVTSANHPEVAVVNVKDLISVVVNGVTVASADTGDSAAVPVVYEEPPAGTDGYYTVDVLTPAAAGGAATTIPGGGIEKVNLHRVTPRNATDSVSITYRETEFEFDSDTTPLTQNLAGIRVRHGANYFAATSTVGVGSADAPSIDVTGAIAGGRNVVVSFGYDVKDTEKDFVTLNSASAGDRRLDGVETLAASSMFEAKVAIFSRADYDKIRTEAGNPTNDDGDITTPRGDGKESAVNIDELNTTYGLTPELETTSDTLDTRLTNVLEELGLEGSDKASDLLAKIIPGKDGDIINVVYQDASPAATISKSAAVDMAAPEVTLVSPSDNFFTNLGTATLSAEVTDTGAGVNQSEITLVSPDLTPGSVVAAPIVSGYKLTMVPQGTIIEGEKKWFAAVKDKVGNVPVRNIPYECTDATPPVCTGTKENEAPKGATAYGTASADNPFKFTVDTRAPTLLSGKSGLYLSNPGSTSGTNVEVQKTNGRQWIRILFELGVGGAPLDPATVSANDFHVDGVAPLDVKINAVAHDGKGRTADETRKGAGVYLQVGQMDTDSRPEVELVDEVRDMAGNIRTEGRLASVADGLAPVLTVTPSTDIDKDEVTITVNSSEGLRTNPTVDVTTDKPVKDEDVTGKSPLTVAVQTGSNSAWMATYKNTAGNANKYYVVVTASDQNDNTAEAGVAATEDDLYSFQVDDAKPRLRFVDAAGEDLKSTKQEEGAVWLVAEFDEDEHADSAGKTTDSFRKVTVTDLTLMNKDSEEVITEDVSQVFASEVDCVDQDTTSDRYDSVSPAENNKCAQRTLAIGLTPGMYNIAVTGVDQTGNEVTGNTDFEVTEATPFELTLRPGQNFISLPGMPMDEGGNIDTLFSDEAISAVSTYDRSRELAGENPWLRSSKDLETGMFSGDITAIEPGKAYFVNSTASVVVEVKLQATGQLPPTIPVRQGFNAIGFWSVTGDDEAEIDLYFGSIGWSVAYSYDPTPGRGWEVIRKGDIDPITFEGQKIEAGKGYLVYALYDSVLTP